jgi:hypothetical protein
LCDSKGQSIQKHPNKVHNQHPHQNGHPSAHHPPNPLKTYPQQPHPHSSSHYHQQQQQLHPHGHSMHKQTHPIQTGHSQQQFKQHNKPVPNMPTHHNSTQPKTNG